MANSLANMSVSKHIVSECRNPRKVGVHNHGTVSGECCMSMNILPRNTGTCDIYELIQRSFEYIVYM